MGRGYRYDEHYEEVVTLADGSSAVLRTVQPRDKVLLRQGFDRLSPESRYARFLASKTALSDRDLRYLTEVDGERHFALGAVSLDPIGREEGLGIARFVRDDGDPEVAEPAVAVVDDAQGKGLGTLLLNRLAAAACERGVKRFKAVFLTENDRMRHLFENLVEGTPGGLRLEYEEGITIAEMDVPEIRDVGGAPEVPRRSALRRLLSQAARGAVTSQFWRTVLRADAARQDDRESE